jgi:hypothetical protein
MTRIKIPPPTSGGLMLSYKCPIKCRHCIYGCAPEWSADWISEEDLDQGLSQLSGKIRPSAWGEIGLNEGLHFSGGEPFLNYKLLLTAVEMANSYNIPSMFVETNCYWCTNDNATRDKLHSLKQAGLKGIMISVNPFYAEHIPFERTQRCIRISQEQFGLRNVMVYQMEYFRQFMELGIRDKISFEDYLVLSKALSAAGHVEMFVMGRATSQLRHFFPKHPARHFFDEPCLPPILREWHNHFDNYGHYMPGYCGGLSLGSWLELDELLEEGLDLDERPILKFLIQHDMQGLFHFAEDFGYQENPQGYISKCDLCTNLRRHLVSKQDFAELQPKEFYTHLM